MYSGLKHSSSSQFVNEMGGALSDLQVLTDHARLDSVRRYAETQIARKRELMDSSGKNLAELLKMVKQSYLDKSAFPGDNLIMIITNHREKTINAIVYFAGNTNKCGKTKMMKLLYFLDFYHFKQTGKSVTGFQYFAWEMGPVPKQLFEELSENMGKDLSEAIHPLPKEGFQKIKPKRAFDDQWFSPRELKILEDLAFIFKDVDANQMVESTHLKNEPWDRTKKEKGLFCPIDYMLAVDGHGGSLPPDEASDRMEERREMFKIFGVA